MAVIEGHQYRVPTRAVLYPQDIDKWEKSEAYQDLLGFLLSLNESVRGKNYSSPCHDSSAVLQLLAMLDTMAGWLQEYKPIADQPQRYGNKAFRDYYARLSKDAEGLVQEILGAEQSEGAKEASVYLVESVGNSTRIDYGTGHELAFLMFLTCLFKIGTLQQQDAQATVNKVFKRYLELVRELQSTYKMEPAGSQGVWSLDDYQFVPFIWGSSQLVMNPKIAPEMFSSESVVEEHADQYLFLGCIKFIMKVKTGPFAEHSNQLWNISGVQSWTKINQGLVKMYKAEVLHKFPVIQHVLFGSLLSIDAAKNLKHLPPPQSGPQISGGMMPPMRGMMPPMRGMMPSAAGMIPPAGGIMPPAGGIMPTAIGMMPPVMGMMPPVSGSSTRLPSSNQRSQSIDVSNITKAPHACMARKPSLDAQPRPPSDDTVVPHPPDNKPEAQSDVPSQ